MRSPQSIGRIKFSLSVICFLIHIRDEPHRAKKVPQIPESTARSSQLLLRQHPSSSEKQHTTEPDRHVSKEIAAWERLRCRYFPGLTLLLIVDPVSCAPHCAPLQLRSTNEERLKSLRRVYRTTLNVLPAILTTGRTHSGSTQVRSRPSGHRGVTLLRHTAFSKRGVRRLRSGDLSRSIPVPAGCIQRMHVTNDSTHAD